MLRLCQNFGTASFSHKRQEAQKDCFINQGGLGSDRYRSMPVRESTPWV